MIEQKENQLLLTFPSPEAAAAFAQYLSTLTQPPPLSASEPSPPSASSPPADPLDSLPRSRHILLTPDRQEAIFNQRAAGMTTHQRLLRAQTTLRDGELPFRQLPTPPPPSGQPSPRLRAAQEGGFADGNGRADRMPAAGARAGATKPALPLQPSPPPRKSHLRPVSR